MPVFSFISFDEQHVTASNRKYFPRFPVVKPDQSAGRIRGYKDRLLFNGVAQAAQTKSFSNTRTGAVNTDYFDTGNPSCVELPNAGRDVRINSGTVVVKNKTIVTSLYLSPGVIFTVNPGISFSILNYEFTPGNNYKMRIERNVR